MTLGAILVIKLGALGDVAQAFGAFQAIRRHHAGAKIVLLTTPPFAKLLAPSPWFDEVWIDERPPAWRLAWLGLRARIRAARFARIYDLQTTSRSDWYFRMLGPGARPEWVGTAPGASHRHVDPRRDLLHNYDRLGAQLALAGIASIPPPDLSWLDADLSRFGLPAHFGLLVPGTSAHRAIKRWPTPNFAAIAALLDARGITPVVVGGGDERDLAAAIRAVCPAARDLTGTTSIPELAALGRKAAIAIGNDTGPMHLIAETRTPTLMLMSRESNPAHCAPRGPAARWLRRDFIKDLPVADVEAAIAELLANDGKKEGSG
ncbi:MAG: glycosyltransferase family 9 protein [Alphaproteobacteria bacterium]|nr:glycosyltransferase family 9 protein [Alphaproteobacteria bacterium]